MPRPVDPTPAGAAIRIGQVTITAVLLVIAVVRADGAGTPLPWILALSLVFAGWYGAGLLIASRSGRRSPGVAIGWLLGLALIWTGAVIVSPEFVWLAFSLWMLAGFLLPLLWAVIVGAAVLVVAIAAPILHTGATSYADVIGPLVGGIFALGISRGYLELVRESRERRRLIASLLAAQEETARLQDDLARTQRESGAGVERARLSRDIHDTLAQSLSSIGLLARAPRISREEQEQTLARIDQLAREGLHDARRIVDALTPAELEGSGLGDALRRMLERMREETGIRTDIRVDEGLPALSTTAEVALLRTAQSALANVRAHAGARRVVVTLADAGDAVRLDVVDDGAGFDLDRWRKGSLRSPAGGYGLHAMRARLREIGGDLEIESAPGDGVALSASVPLSAGRPS